MVLQLDVSFLIILPRAGIDFILWPGSALLSGFLFNVPKSKRFIRVGTVSGIWSIFYHFGVGVMDQKPTVAVIIPVHNESCGIGEALRHFVSLGADEVIVVDGKSLDGTYEIVKEGFPDVMCCQTAFAERSLQMNLGASKSKSDVFIFAHIDMRLPLNAVEMVREKVQKSFIGGGFKKSYNPSSWVLRAYIYLLNQLYLARMHCLVGTNAIFVTRAIFERIKGFSEVAFLEDMMFSECLNKEGRIAIIDHPVIVSSRKYFRNGVIKQILRNIRIVFGYKFLHESPVKLREIYQG